MFHVYISDQISVILILCFSFLNAAVTVAFNKEGGFTKAFGLSFSGIFLLALISIFYPDAILRVEILRNISAAYLGLLVLLVLCWRWKSIPGAVILTFTYPFMVLLCNIYLSGFEAYLTIPFVLEGIILVLVISIIVLLQNYLLIKEPKITWGAVLLGLGQILQYTFPADTWYVIVVCQLTAFTLFSVYLLKMTRERVSSKLAAAESKLSDVNRTINYEVKKRVLEMEVHNEHLLNLAQRDPLVNALNKKGILASLKNLIENPKIMELTIVLFDIDNFKTVNDTKGHVSGDLVLRRIAQIAKENIRDVDILGRYGGDEFLIILPKANLTDALVVAERFREKVSREPDVSISIGLASFPEDGRTLQGLLEAADAGLYLSKKRGKNAVSHIRLNA